MKGLRARPLISPLQNEPMSQIICLALIVANVTPVVSGMTSEWPNTFVDSLSLIILICVVVNKQPDKGEQPNTFFPSFLQAKTDGLVKVTLVCQ